MAKPESENFHEIGPRHVILSVRILTIIDALKNIKHEKKPLPVHQVLATNGFGATTHHLCALSYIVHSSHDTTNLYKWILNDVVP